VFFGKPRPSRAELIERNILPAEPVTAKIEKKAKPPVVHTAAVNTVIWQVQ